MAINDHILAFEIRRPAQARFTAKLESLVRDLMAANSLNFHITESRTKDIQSFRDKATRPTKSYINPIEEITDLSGIRIIAYYQDEVDKICKLIESEFLVDTENSVLHQPEGAEFGYLSKHYVIQLSSKRNKLAEWSGLDQLKAEIQVRTVLQHAWAAVSHKLQYKREDDVPVPLRRKLFRLSALFELADEEFISLRGTSGEITHSIKTSLGAGNHDLPIDAVSLGEFLKSSIFVADVENSAKKAGFIFDLPEGDQEDYDYSSLVSELVQLCALVGVQTIKDFESILQTARPWMEGYLTAQISMEGMRKDWYVSTPFIFQLLLVGAKIDKIQKEHLYSLHWDHGIADRVFRVAQSMASKNNQ